MQLLVELTSLMRICLCGFLFILLKLRHVLQDHESLLSDHFEIPQIASARSLNFLHRQ